MTAQNSSVSIPDITTNVPNTPTNTLAMEMAELAPNKRSVIQYETLIGKQEQKIKELKSILKDVRTIERDYGRLKEENINLTIHSFAAMVLLTIGSALLSTSYEIVKEINVLKVFITSPEALIGFAWLFIIFGIFLGFFLQLIKPVFKYFKK